MITVLTGLPGSGKSLRAVELMHQYLAEGRPVFAAHFADLNVPGVQTLAHINDWRECPPGSVIFADEVQHHWRKQDGNRAPIPPVAALEIHRSTYAVDFVLVTQDPRFLCPHVRRLSQMHEHRVRPFQAPMSHVYVWNEVQEDPKEGRANADVQTWFFPKEHYGKYKSAEVHTAKMRIPTRVKLMVALIPLVVLCIWFVSNTLGDDDTAQAANIDQREQTTRAPGAPRELPISDEAERFKPAIPGMPWTAPAYADRAVVSEPEIYCMSSEKSCTCLTEQGTRSVVPPKVCRHIARYGIYNPYRAPATASTAKQISPTQAAPGDGLNASASLGSVHALAPQPVQPAQPGRLSRGVGAWYVPPDYAPHKTLPPFER